ncbi:MAG TPA: dihydrofolate reductase family protein [Thermoanaerobaculia bacterium]|nr:dihydrofolate reductase family protein [Thermoanaerobaculia bacterium]
MKRIRYSVAMSLDGFIAGPAGESDWIVSDPDIDFDALLAEFDTVVMGRKTFEEAWIGGDTMPGMRVIVVSRTLKDEDYPDVTVVGAGMEGTLRELRRGEGKDIWLFGGGSLFRSLLELGLVDTVEVAVIPVLLGDGRPMLEHPTDQAQLRLAGTRLYEKSGIMALHYDVEEP